MMKQVIDMHRQFGFEPDLSPQNMIYRNLSLLEEIGELDIAYLKGDRVAQLDAIADLLIFVLGTAYMLGFDTFQVEVAFGRVMESNLKKVPTSSYLESKRGWGLDLIKPLGWKAPYLDDLV